LLDEMDAALAVGDGTELFRCQGRAQVLRNLLMLDQLANTTLKPPPGAPVRKPTPVDPSGNYNPHFAR
jgi:hypothetical protein